MKRNPACLAGSAVLRLLVPARRQGSPEGARKILVIGAGGIGDVVMKTPVFSCLRARFPHAEIVFFTSSGPASEIIAGHPGIDRLIVLEEREAFSSHHPIEALRYLGRLRAERFDLSITTHYGISFGGAVFSYLVGAPARVGFDKGGRGALHSHRVKVDDPDSRHAVDWNLDLVRALGVEVGREAPAVYLSAEERKQAADLLRGSGVGDGQMVVTLFQSSKWESKLWFAARFAQVADAISDAYRSRILLVGAEADRPAIDEIARAMKARPIVAVGQGIRQSAALVERSRLVIACDSGLMHVAAAVGTPVVGLFGPETPVRVGPYGERSAVVRHQVPCSPCRSARCRLEARRCMEMISVEEVLRIIEEHSADWGLDAFRKLDPHR